MRCSLWHSSVVKAGISLCWMRQYREEKKAHYQEQQWISHLVLSQGLCKMIKGGNVLPGAINLISWWAVFFNASSLQKVTWTFKDIGLKKIKESHRKFRSMGKWDMALVFTFPDMLYDLGTGGTTLGFGFTISGAWCGHQPHLPWPAGLVLSMWPAQKEALSRMQDEVFKQNSLCQHT